MRHIPLPLSNGLITRLVLEPIFLKVDLCCDVRFGLATCGGGLGRRFWVCSRSSVIWWSYVQRLSDWRACSMEDV